VLSVVSDCAAGTVVDHNSTPLDVDAWTVVPDNENTYRSSAMSITGAVVLSPIEIV